jgi:hypothetical protein
MYFKIFLTLLILFVSINLLSDLYNFYNTGVWEPFSATMEDNTKISKALIIGSGEKSPQDLKSDWKQVGLDGDTVNCNGLVRYGANNSWVVKHSLGNIKCSSDIFGNHLPGVEKSCECKTTSWTNEERTENLTQKIFTKEKDLCVDPNKGGYVVYTGKACGVNKNNIQWMNAYTSPDQAAKQYNKEGCNFQLTNEKLIAEYKNPTIRKGNLINTSVELPFNWKIEFSYTPTKRQNKSTNIFRLTDGVKRNVDNYKDRLFFVFKRGEETDLEIGIGTKERNYIYYTNTKFKLNKTYKIKVDVRDTQMNIFVNDNLVHTQDITAKRDIMKNCHLYFSDKYYISAKCVVEDFSLTSSGSDKSWMEKYMGDCGKNPKLDKDRILQTSVSELLRYDKSGSSQSIEWHKTGQEKNTVHIPQPNPISKLTSDYIPFIDDDNRDWVPDYIDMVNPTATSNIHLGKYFAKKVSNLRGFKLPDIYQSEYELIGKTILRAEFSKRRGAEDVEMIKHKDKIVKLFDHLLGIETDTYTTINNKKSERQFSSVPVYTQPEETVKSQTSNMFSDNSNSSAQVKKDFNQSKYTNKYRPRDPNEYPRPIDAVWSFITGL